MVHVTFSILFFLFIIFAGGTVGMDVEINSCPQLFTKGFIKYNDENVRYYLTRDLACNGKYPPLGDSQNQFKGTFDLNGFKLIGLEIEPPTPFGSIFLTRENNKINISRFHKKSNIYHSNLTTKKKRYMKKIRRGK